jgi:multicomponent Na+:H+ antiporter subunit D
VTALLVLPLALPLATAVATLLLRRSVRAQEMVGTAGAALHLAGGAALLAAVLDGEVLAVQGGGWPAPFGISLVADVFSAVMVVLTGLMGLCALLFARRTVDAARKAVGFHPLVQVLLMGVSGAFLTGDLFNLYVWFEVMLMASFVLLALGGERPQLEGGLKYVTLNLVASAIFLAAVGILYGTAGTLNMADLSTVLPGTASPGVVTAVAALFLVAFGVKAALFPFFFWLPASYHTPPVAVTALFAGLLTKVGVYALVRVFTLVFIADADVIRALLLPVSGLTMLTGVLGAAAQYDVRKILAFHIVSQIGYMAMGLALGTPLALAGVVLFLVHNILAKTGLFLVAGAMERIKGSFELREIGGLWRERPFLSVVFLVSALSLAGIPPLPGFWGKYLLVRAGLEAGSWEIVAVSLLVSVLTMFSMTKIWAEGFWKADPRGEAAPAPVRLPVSMVVPTVLLPALSLLAGLGAPWVVRVCLAAAGQLSVPTAYLRAVLGG